MLKIEKHFSTYFVLSSKTTLLPLSSFKITSCLFLYKLLITLWYLYRTLIQLYLSHVCRSLIFNLVIMLLFKWEISFKMFWLTISNSAKSLFQLQTIGMCSSNPNDHAFSSLDESQYDEKLCTMWQMYFVFSLNVNTLSFWSLTKFLMTFSTVMEFCLIDLSRLHIIPLNRTNPTWGFSFIDNCMISRFSLRFSWSFCCNSVLIIILAIFCCIFLLPDFIACFTFANIGRSFLHVLIKLISLLILKYSRLTFSNDLTFLFSNFLFIVWIVDIGQVNANDISLW